MRREKQLLKAIIRLDRRQQRLQDQSDSLTRIRLVLFILGALLSGVLFLSWGPVVWLWGTLLLMTPFIFTVRTHRGIDQGLRRNRLWLAIKGTHLARLQLDWGQIPTSLPVPDQFEHPFALDLDLLGPRSLHQLMDTAVTQEGSLRLRQWLLHNDPDPDWISRQQARVAELREMSRFRDKLRLHGGLIDSTNDEKWVGQRLRDWLSAAADQRRLGLLLLALSVLSAVVLPLFWLNMSGQLGAWWLLPWLVYAGLYAGLGLRWVSTLFADALFLQNGMATLIGVFSFLERFPYGRMPLVEEMCAPFLGAERPSAHIRRARWVIAGVGVRQNPLLGLLINAFVPWDLLFGYLLSRIKQNLAQQLPGWLEIWVELEALSALATFGWLQGPASVFPYIVRDERPVLQAKGLGHPLIPANQRIGNDYNSDQPGAVSIITGSNMAGKSSFLRALGCNLALAGAGAPVVAQSLAISPMRLYASIRVTDSLADGISFFYAEVRRLQALLAALAEVDKKPLFFLIDEIFRGTNNRERLIGSRAYIRALAEGVGAGVIATHDLELVQLAEERPSIRNYHFRDEVVDGVMIFDYILHPGPCPTTNALKIMLLAGLPVDEKF